MVLNMFFSADPLVLATGLVGSSGVLGALALGLRHGLDWDHIAAITDITSSTTADARGAGDLASLRPAAERVAPQFLVAVAATPMGPDFSHSPPPPAARVFVGAERRSLALATFYALGHGTMVVFLGLLAILFSSFLPEWIDPIMERVVGVTLVLLGLYLFYSLFHFLRGQGDFRIRSRWMLVFAGVRKLWRRVRPFGPHGHHHQQSPADTSQGYGARTSYGIGLIHGIGAETGTQVLIIGTAVGATSTGMSVATLFVFVLGLLISNAFIAVVTARGFISVEKRQALYAVVGGAAALFSLALGILYLTNSGALLPDLGPYLGWIGGPAV